MSIVIKAVKNADTLYKPIKSPIIKYDEDAIGFDDIISKQKREIIREHYDSWHNPTCDIYEKEPHLDEYSFKKLMDGIVTPKRMTDDKSILGLPIHNIRKIHKFSRRECNSYRGGSLVDAPDWTLKKLKDEGIKTVIDVEGYGDYYEKRIKKFGMDFVSFSTDIYWHNPNLDKSSREFIEPFKKFINAVKKDYFYIGCMEGNHKTDIAMTLSNFFNTNRRTLGNQHAKYWGTSDYDDVSEIYKALTPKDKQELEIDKSFETEICDRLKDIY